MQKRLMGKTGEWVSLLGFGCMRFPQKDGKTDVSQVQDMNDYAKANGVNYYDTAYVYGDGESERVLGNALKKYSRDSFFIADKLPVWLVNSEEDAQKLFDTSLSRLSTDYIDFYLLHSLNRGTLDRIKKYHLIEFLKQKRAEGKIKYIGFSFHDTPEVFSEIADMFDWDFVQIQLNYLDWEVQRAKDTYDIITKKGFPCIVMEPIRGGALINLPDGAAQTLKKASPGRSLSAWALGYCASKPQVKLILSGMSNFSQVKENVDTLSNFVPMNESEYAALDKAVEFINSQPHIGCTGCRYCMPCPKGVNIPGCFSEYNDYMRLHDKQRLTEMFKNELSECGPEKCVSCGTCIKKCPQHLSVPEELLKVKNIKKEVGLK